MSHNLKHKATKAATWRMADMLCQRAGGLVVSVVLARLLLPEEFGAVALLSIFIHIAYVFVNAGFGSALVQRKNTTLLEESSVFYCNIAMALLLYGIIYLLAPLVPVFYDKPEMVILCPLLRVSALNLITGSFCQVQISLLEKQLHFKPLFIVSVAVLLVQAVVGITMAYCEFGVWALVFSYLISEVFRTLLINVLSQWRPVFQFSFSALAPLFSFGWKILLSRLLDTFFVQIYSFLIGRYYTPADLAFYNRGKAWPHMLATSVTSTISSVLFPALSQIQNDKTRMKRAMQKSQQVLAFLLWPSLMGVALTSESLVRLVLTDKWLPAVPYMQIISVSMCLWPIHVTNLQILTATGRSDLFLKLEILKKTLVVIMLIIAFPFGIMAMVWGQLVISFGSLFINAHFTKKLIGYSLLDQLHALLSPLSGILVMVIGVAAVGLLPMADTVSLGVRVCVGVSLYVGWAHLFKSSAYFELRGLFIGRIVKMVKR